MKLNIQLYIVCYILIFLVFSAWSQEQGKIYGYIYDSKTLKPIEKACVYLESTTRGAETDNSGIYFIPDILQFLLCSGVIGHEVLRNKKN